MILLILCSVVFILFKVASRFMILLKFKHEIFLKGAAGWLKDTGCNLKMFLDPDRSLYRALGLPRSVSKVLFVAYSRSEASS